ncbi:unnamed protein product [Acanthoscelides obtectus]|uniref:Uncharacterized protein n=1 Tax=Acanthoscelides obtectus TaxID=200917 RepID=A0A9P0L1C5_ACAOB|nr:unnamed protein product [Acanthoscelides obtectus]CAK1672114.1 hypothetical protein AOBTE_LOCUS28653 [Acanthoscelides obtectus]
MPKRQSGGSDHSGPRRKRGRKYDRILDELKRLKNKITRDSTSDSSSCFSDDDQNISGTEMMNQIITEAEIHPIPSGFAVSAGVPPENIDASGEFEFLGAKPKSKNTTSQPLHTKLTVRWNAFLQDGVDKECCEKIMEKYPLFENCPLMKSPVLSPEVA